MANQLFDLGRQAFADGDISWSADNIKASLSRTDLSVATGQFVSEIVAVATSGNLTSKTNVSGVVDAADVTYVAVAAGAAIPYIYIYKDTGTPATSPLLAKIDNAGNLPVTPHGGDISVQWDNGANKIFKL
jgi:hypothetical protein